MNADPIRLTGVAASPGAARGTARVIAGPDDFSRFAAGEILVCRTTSPAWTPLLARAAGVITETGGILAHAAIVAREYGVPAVLAVDNAISVIPDGTIVQVDGHRGQVTVSGPSTGRS